MGDIQQFELIRTLAPRIEGPILEIGSKRYADPPISFDYRTLTDGRCIFPRQSGRIRAHGVG